ncbi:hypothetical protein ACE1CA_02030 [Aerosakkonemataceae cyanobacterium BLCC-F167]|uniref:Uncharacterized protein n=1 Tax=Floridaenema evergladense BLCC-F167 TaxID=3153639 RepID=A0ABV4WDY6_9CYAN
MRTDLRIPNKLCRAFRGVCSRIESKIKGELTQRIEAKVTNELNDPRIKAKVANTVKQSLANRLGQYRNWEIARVSSKGNNFILTLRN